MSEIGSFSTVLKQDHHRSLIDNLYNYQQQGIFTDVTLQIDGHEFKAHRYILAAASKFFHAMFISNMVESTLPIIKLSVINPKQFGLLLAYMYTGELSIDEDTVGDILGAATYLQIDPVVKECVETLECVINMGNYPEILEIADTYALESVQAKVYAHVSKNFLNGGPMIRWLDVDLLEYVVSRDIPLDGLESDLLKMVLRWFSCNETEDRDEYAEKILRHIRFEEISQPALEKVIDTFESTCKGTEVCDYLREKLPVCHKSPAHLQSTRGMKPAILRVGGFCRSERGGTNDISFSFINERIWRPLTTIPHSVECNYGVAVANNNLYIVGGCYEEFVSEVVLPNAYCYKPHSNSWNRITCMCIDRCRFTLTALGNNWLFAVGGTTTNCDGTNTAECYNIASDKWSLIESLPESRQRHAAVAIEHQMTNLLFVSGGLDEQIVLASVFMYNPATGSWSSCAPLLAPRADHAMFAYRGEIYVYGGWYTFNTTRVQRTKVPTIDAYNIETNTWRHVTTVPRPRFQAAVSVHRSKVYIIGGYYHDHDYSKLTVVECYDLDSNTWEFDVKDSQNFWEHTSVILDVPKHS